MDDPNNEHLRDEYCNAAGDVIFENDPNKPLNEEDWQRFEAAFGLDKPMSEDEIREWEAMTEVTENSPDDLPSGSGGYVMGYEDNEAEIEQMVGKKVQTPQKDHLENSLRQPLHRRQGYENRIASREAEMERLVTDILIERGSDWYSAGANIQRVLLSPNSRNLTIYYTIDDESGKMSRKEWRRLNKAMSARIHKAIFKRMDVRYVPSIFFERVREDDSNSSALDAAFAQIEEERLANFKKPA